MRLQKLTETNILSVNKMSILYHYVHCPYCIRVRMTLAFLGENYRDQVLQYDDESTPLELTGVKMLPIWQDKNGKSMNESLDIIKALDKDNRIPALKQADNEELENWLSKLGSNVHNLAMPYWVWSPEFNESSRIYFEAKKSKKRGPFKELAKKRADFEKLIVKDLVDFESNLTPWFKSEEFTLADIMVAAHLWGLFVVPEFRFSDKMHSYLMAVKSKTKFDYHAPFWAN